MHWIVLFYLPYASQDPSGESIAKGTLVHPNFVFYHDKLDKNKGSDALLSSSIFLVILTLPDAASPSGSTSACACTFPSGQLLLWLQEVAMPVKEMMQMKQIPPSLLLGGFISTVSLLEGLNPHVRSQALEYCIFCGS